MPTSTVVPAGMLPDLPDCSFLSAQNSLKRLRRWAKNVNEILILIRFKTKSYIVPVYQQNVYLTLHIASILGIWGVLTISVRYSIRICTYIGLVHLSNRYKNQFHKSRNDQIRGVPVLTERVFREHFLILVGRAEWLLDITDLTGSVDSWVLMSEAQTVKSF